MAGYSIRYAKDCNISRDKRARINGLISLIP